MITLKSMRKNGLILGAFAVIATGLVVGIAKLTEAPIAAQQRAELMNTLNVLIPPQRHDNDLYHACRLIDAPELGGEQPKRLYIARLQQQAQAIAIEATAPNGYSGAIKLLVAINVDGSVAGVRVLQHNETPGLGDKIEHRKSDWIESFNGMTVRGDDDKRWAVQRDGGSFDQFTGATITPRAVVGAVARTVSYVKQHQQQLLSAQLARCSEAS
ncbi:electron transport complex subunit RsxG [Idiomarina xiamenensis]|uniref:Ion-translocating oxidoreductase complex subunit G n=1 Tax=Idiomarina xiamenensis 10-D-4 TaxID=740709 RepID=K2J9I4_9GAMM|nr:electron transport complex subunit RsxG [Idiomarina xiamenensis]EKE79906.1 NADH:ubiquinone oxidoreductase subunit RnfG [Idiomarina xiamenensis 10-D-4]